PIFTRTSPGPGSGTGTSSTCTASKPPESEWRRTDFTSPFLSLLAERFDGVEARRAPRRPHAEEESDEGRDAQRQHHRVARHDRLPIAELGDEVRGAVAEEEAEEPAADRDDDGLDEELEEHVPAP